MSAQAGVVDGDSLKIGGTRIRPFGIDAPERGYGCQAGGEDLNAWMVTVATAS